MSNKLTIKIVLILLLVNLFYVSVSIATKFTSQQETLSVSFFGGLAIVIAVLGVYAILWQQLLKHIELTTAYMFKGTSLIFVFVFSALLFSEQITLQNIVGAVFIIAGIVLFAKS